MFYEQLIKTDIQELRIITVCTVPFEPGFNHLRVRNPTVENPIGRKFDIDEARKNQY